MPINLSIAEHAKKHGIIQLKRYGQNFIFDASLCDKITRSADLKPGDWVLEIGPGSGGLTRSILACNPSSLTVIETDRRILPLLEELKSHYPNLHIISGDALKYKISNLCSERKVKIISNLPYNVGTVLVINWLKEASCIQDMTLMLQKEVVERMRAEVGTKHYGRLSVICQLICNVEKCFDVSPKAFYPPPKVDSSIVKLTPHSEDMQPSNEAIETLERITNLAFSGRRKMVRSSLKALPNLESELEKAGIPEQYRAEDISPGQYLTLSQNIAIFSRKNG